MHGHAKVKEYCQTLLHVKYGLFGDTPQAAFVPLISMANLRPGSCIFDIGSGHSLFARKIATYGFKVGGGEVEAKLWNISNEIGDRIQAFIEEHSSKFGYRRVCQVLKAAVQRVNLVNGDLFELFRQGKIDLQGHDAAYLYYPEPEKADNKDEFFLNELNNMLADPDRGLSDEAPLMILRIVREKDITTTYPPRLKDFYPAEQRVVGLLSAQELILYKYERNGDWWWGEEELPIDEGKRLNTAARLTRELIKRENYLMLNATKGIIAYPSRFGSLLLQHILKQVNIDTDVVALCDWLGMDHYCLRKKNSDIYIDVYPEDFSRKRGGFAIYSADPRHKKYKRII